MAESRNVFPKEFSDLEPLREWSVATDTERIQKRDNSSDDELRKFYDALLPRMDEVFQYLNRFPLDRMPADARRLFDLAISFMEIANIVERGRSRVAWRFDVSRFVPMRERSP
jgi:hypothetical protein